MVVIDCTLAMTQLNAMGLSKQVLAEPLFPWFELN